MRMRRVFFNLFYFLSTLYGSLFITLMAIDTYKGGFSLDRAFSDIFFASSVSLIIGIPLSRRFKIYALFIFSGLLIFSVSFALWEFQSSRQVSMDSLGIAFIAAVCVMSAGSIASGILAISAEAP